MYKEITKEKMISDFNAGGFHRILTIFSTFCLNKTEINILLKYLFKEFPNQYTNKYYLKEFIAENNLSRSKKLYTNSLSTNFNNCRQIKSLAD